MKKIVNLTDIFSKLVKDCDVLFLEKNITEIIYPVIKEGIEIKMKSAKKHNKKTISDILIDGANIYALWVKHKNKKWELKYIGQRKASGVRERLNQHLFSKHKKTGSKLENIKKELQDGYRIGISVIFIIPDEMRTSVEESLIKDKKPVWNLQHT